MIGPALAFGLLLLFAAFAWPRYGIAARWIRYGDLLQRAALEHALKHLHHCEYLGENASLEGLAGAVGVSRDRVVRLLDTLERAGLVEVARGRARLTHAGRREALRVIRTHRLWERFFAEHSGLDETHWHDAADRREHVTSAEEMEQLAASLGHPRFDPHGAPIPTASGDLPSTRGIRLSELKPGQIGRVVHVEDEPTALHEQLVLQGLNVGALVRALVCDASSIQLDLGGEEQRVALVAAANVSVEPLEMPRLDDARFERLAHLPLGRRARVVGLLPSCHGIQRRRLLDLGLVAGTIVEPELRSASGDPTAYRIRGALIALRAEQAKRIQVEPLE